jgi:hypothetical protein
MIRNVTISRTIYFQLVLYDSDVMFQKLQENFAVWNGIFGTCKSLCIRKILGFILLKLLIQFPNFILTKQIEVNQFLWQTSCFGKNRATDFCIPVKNWATDFCIPVTSQRDVRCRRHVTSRFLQSTSRSILSLKEAQAAKWVKVADNMQGSEETRDGRRADLQTLTLSGCKGLQFRPPFLMALPQLGLHIFNFNPTCLPRSQISTQEDVRELL